MRSSRTRRDFLRTAALGAAASELPCPAQLAAPDLTADPATRLWYRQAAPDWNEALPIGNGRLGAMIFGGVPEEHLQFNDNTLYAEEPGRRDLPLDVTRNFEEVERLLRNRQFAEADALITKHWCGRSWYCYQPLGDLHLFCEHSAAPAGYTRDLDLATATAHVRYQVAGVTFTREILASHPAGVIAIRLTASQPGALRFRAELRSVHPTARMRASADREIALAGKGVAEKYLRLNPRRAYGIWSLLRSGAQRPSRVVRRRVRSLQIRTVPQLENLALRHQLGVLRRSVKRPKLTSADRLLWAWLSDVWDDWRSALVIVKPETVIAWHRAGFRLFWTWKVRHDQPDRPVVPEDIRALIRRISRENPLWGAPRIHGELLKLGIDVGETSVGKYMIGPRKPPSQNWQTFLENHIQTMVSVDFFTVPTIRFQILYVFLVLAHDRRRIVHFNVTDHPTAEWTAQQLREAFPWDSGPRYLLRDRDCIFGGEFSRDVEGRGIEEVLSTPRSPWQRAYVERVIGSLRRECLDHVIVFNEQSLRAHLKSFLEYYHEARTHLSLGKDAPLPRPAQAAGCGGRRPRAGGRTPSPLRAARGLRDVQPQI